MVIIIIILCITIVFLGFYCYRITNKQQETIKLNDTIKQQNQQITLENDKLLLESKNLQQQIQEKKDLFNKVSESLDDAKDHYLSIAKVEADIEVKEYKKQLEKELQEVINDLTLESSEKAKEIAAARSKYDKLINSAQSELKSLEDKQLAYIQEQQRKEEMDKKQDYYRLVISDQDIQDINMLRNVQFTMSNKNAVDKVIWEVYYKPAYDTLSSHFFKSATDKISGIYKLTSIKSGLIYIGQSLDCRTRWRDHIKNALAFGSASNKLYQEMKKQGPENFTFEILEAVDRTELDLREKYWIEFYKAKEYGLNAQKGNG